jgi:uncharacterized membrane protein
MRRSDARTDGSVYRPGAFVFGALAFLALWMVYNGISGGSAYDKYPFILLNLVLSCLAAMQGAILLIAAKRSDQVASALAEHDYETVCRAEQLIETLTRNLAELHEEHRAMRAQLVAVTRLLDAVGRLRAHRVGVPVMKTPPSS